MSSRSTRILRLPSTNVDRLREAARSSSPVTGFTHNFYKYPARFSPVFARAAIETLSRPSQLVLDPFVGGGTSLVEARLCGRLGFGSDISELATFVTRAKTRVLQTQDISRLSGWASNLDQNIEVSGVDVATGERSDYYLRNLNTRHGWALNRAIASALEFAQTLDQPRQIDFARCVILRAAQWAIDGRKSFASVKEFRLRVVSTAWQLLAGAQEFASAARSADRLSPAHCPRRTRCETASAELAASLLRAYDYPAPDLVLTSPPYPGVHVLYHRWQVHGGRETPAPFWIANKLDGSGDRYYTLGARADDENQFYFESIKKVFASLHSVVSARTNVVQVLAFSNPEWQLPKYLAAMSDAGFHEVLIDSDGSSDGRLWRVVPGRKWYARQKGKTHSSQEVVLFHKKSM